ncbi:MAG: hypothetical protein HY904_00945 [Deltaproteobacteria bacterium]|nr:hypothetical protein [Deltaproteobacteria bacterium]
MSHYDPRKVQSGGTLADMAGTVALVDAATLARAPLLPVCAGAYGMALDEERNILFVACALADQVAEVDLAASPPRVVLHDVGSAPITPPATVHEPMALARNPADGTLWLSCQRSRTLRVVDPADWSVTAGPTLSAGPHGSVFTPAGTLLVAVRESAELVEVDPVTRQLRRPALRMEPGHLHQRS